jgi:aminoglycoside 3-N-acetyltransferase
MSLTKIITELGLHHGDTVLAHVDTTIGLQISGQPWGNSGLRLLLRSILKAVGPEGTLITPTFNWDFCRSAQYCHETTPSQCGIFSNFVLFHDESIRSLHPIYSFAAIGDRAAQLMENVSQSSFGAGSVFEKLHKHNAQILFIGVDFGLCTFVHYLEQLHQVPYRSLKVFSGTINAFGASYVDNFDYFVRDLSIETTKHRRGAPGYYYVKKLGDPLIEDGRIACHSDSDGRQVLLTDCETLTSLSFESVDISEPTD